MSPEEQPAGTRYDLSIIIPAYNEAERIAPGLESLVAWAQAAARSVEVVLVDDGSADGTVQVAERAIAGRLPLQVLRNEPNRGKGFSVRRGLLAGGGRIVGFSDADFSTPVAEADRLLAAIEGDGYDIAIGSRAMRGSQLERRQPRLRELAGRLFSLYYRALLVPGIVDSQCGFKFMRREVAHVILPLQTLEGWAFDLELLYIARRLGYCVAQLPVRWLDDPASKVRMLRDGLRMAADVLRVWWRHRRLQAQVPGSQSRIRRGTR